MKKVLIGFIVDGKAGGIDKYLLNFFHTVNSDAVQMDFLTNHITEPLRQELAQGNASLYEVSSLMHPVRQYRQIRELIRKNHYDIAYFNISTAIAYPAVKAAHDGGVPKVYVHSHSAGYDCENALKRRLMTAIHQLLKGPLCRSANGFYTCSDKAAEWLFTKDICRSGEVHRIQNAVDTSGFAFSPEKRQALREKYGIADKFVIGTVGNMVYQKNQPFLIDVFQRLVQSEPNATLLIVGDGPLRPVLEAKVHEYGLEGKVLMPGRMNTADGYMSAFDVFALPSNFEGMPIVSVEAQCSQLPCVFSDTITREAGISNMCDFAPLGDIDTWVKMLLHYQGVDRKEMRIVSDLSSFDIEEQKETLQNILQ